MLPDPHCTYTHVRMGTLSLSVGGVGEGRGDRGLICLKVYTDNHIFTRIWEGSTFISCPNLGGQYVYVLS